LLLRTENTSLLLKRSQLAVIKTPSGKVSRLFQVYGERCF
jgi:hypothetical protein